MLRARFKAIVVAVLVAGCFSPSGADTATEPGSTSGVSTMMTSTSGSTGGSATTATTDATMGTTAVVPTTSANTATADPTTGTMTTGPTTGTSATSATGTATATGNTTDVPEGCGDMVIDPNSEQCDDGNTVDGDGCSATCQIEGGSCGDGLLQDNEECDGDANCEGCSRVIFRVFVTDVPMTAAAIMGLEKADKTCTDLANTAGLSGRFVAWLSVPGQSAASRLEPSLRPWVTPTGVDVAEDWDDLTDGSILVPLNVNQDGVTLPIPAGCGQCPVWTGTGVDGEAAGGNCDGWSGGAMMMGTIGDCTQTATEWTFGCSQIACNASARIYCFEKPLHP